VKPEKVKPPSTENPTKDCDRTVPTTMRLSGINTLLTGSAVFNAAAAFHSSAFNAPRTTLSTGSTSAISATGRTGENEVQFGLDRRTFFQSAVLKTAAASAILTNTPSSLGVANAADSFPKVYLPPAHSMDGKLGAFISLVAHIFVSVRLTVTSR
jgi:hypothetical protein